MRDLREVPHSTERCKITIISVIAQTFHHFSLSRRYIFCKLLQIYILNGQFTLGQFFLMSSYCLKLIIFHVIVISYPSAASCTPLDWRAGAQPQAVACRC